MLFGSAVVVFMLLAGSGESRPHRSTTHLWLQSDTRPTPLDLTRKPPIDLRSAKICGANGLGAFLPISDDFAVGAALSSYRLTATQRAAQYVIALRFRF
jgi:hypothetical protein